ncbi:MAG: DUF3343 domain-containing protein [Elusimicrobia bacterium]|jgi:hypothetical protein|nr:DUF3343 domain-containing protein [Elusimicrobiota bacterium]
MKKYLITFENTYRVLEAEKRLTGVFNGVTTIPTPESMSTDCGVSLSLKSNKSRTEVRTVLKDSGISFSKIIKS